MRAIDDPVAYAKALYGRSERERLRVINYQRVRRGKPAIASLAETTLRRPMEA